MNFIPVTSSLITGVSYDPAAQELTVRFHGSGDKKQGPACRYSNVTQEQYDEMMAAKSIGGHYIKRFRGNADHPSTKLEETK